MPRPVQPVARVAARVVAMETLPERGQFFALGGGTLFRGFDLAERQGSAALGRELRAACRSCDATWDAARPHGRRPRNLWLAAFTDVGAVYTNGLVVGNVAHAAPGAGLPSIRRLFSFIEHVTFRFDVAKTLNDKSPFSSGSASSTRFERVDFGSLYAPPNANFGVAAVSVAAVVLEFSDSSFSGRGTFRSSLSTASRSNSSCWSNAFASRSKSSRFFSKSPYARVSASLRMQLALPRR